MHKQPRRVAFVGVPDRSVVEWLREHEYRVEGLPGDSIVALAKEIYRLHPALIHARTAHIKAALVAKLLDVPLLLQAGREEACDTFTARAARMAARTLCSGAATREALLARGAPASTTCVLRSLIDLDADVRAAAIAPPLLDPSARWVVAASPCDGGDRGHHDLLLAFLSLANTRPRLRLLIAGDGAEAPRLRSEAERAGAGTRVMFQPVSLEQLPSVLARATAVVGPSRSGNLPDPLPEALAVGAAVIATAVGSHPAWICEGRTGWLVPPRAPAALAARLAQVLDHPESAEKVRVNARALALEAASPRSAAQELARCYAAVSRAPAMPPGGIPRAARELQRA
jgi:glycosyltransferase involved in cell wall biosynthesis